MEISQESNRRILSGNNQCNYQLKAESEIIRVLPLLRGFKPQCGALNKSYKKI